MQNLSQEQQANFSVLLWSIWKRRNNKVWNNISETNTTVCERARHLITSWKQAQQIRSSANISQPIQQHIHWEKPSRGRYKCNIDASFSPIRNKVGIGMCIRDDHGRYVAAKTEWLSPILDVEIGEAMGLLSALKWVDELQLKDMDFEMDCKRVVDCLYSSGTYNSELGDILRDCRFILATSLVNSHVKATRHIPLKITSIEVEFVVQFNEKLLVKQKNEILQILDVASSEQIEISRTEFMTPSTFIFLCENQLFLTLKNRTVSVWNFCQELVTSFKDQLLWHPSRHQHIHKK
ncbi:hypothetical protein QL285_093387 [Trifolium repens]|nr:hypothetical protein QL285_093387 [Trifolium repens]